jgi:hypothetical protein
MLKVQSEQQLAEQHKAHEEQAVIIGLQAKE